MVFLGLVAGLVLLLIGAEILVRGASKIAAGLGISPLVVGLTVVAFGTSSPELAVSIGSSLTGEGSIALGNIIGSNIANILLILGLSAVAAPLVVAQKLVRVDVPVMIGISLLVWIMAVDGSFNWWEGMLLFSGLVGYIVFLIWESKQENQAVQDEYAQEYAVKGKLTAKDWVINLAFVAVGLAMLALGAQWLVNSAVQIATELGVSEAVIGLTLVAVGTSLPELATSVIASLRGERDIAVGNVIGSNIFNLLGVLGLSSAIAGLAVGPISVSLTMFQFDIPVMIGVALACLPIFFSDYRVDRWQGGLFLGYYILYTTYLILREMQYDMTTFGFVMIDILLPITVVALVIVIVRQGLAQKSNP
jgi:cation:H+ antiporter